MTMHISIWRQFSSNHSANFTVIGVFETAEAASAAASELRMILLEIEAWYAPRKLDAIADEMTQNNGRFSPTPPEVDVGRRYGVEWPWGIDWSYGYRSRDRWTTGQPVEQFENLVFVHPITAETWQGPQPFDALMAKLGGTVFVDAGECGSYPDTLVVVSITCTAPDEAKAGWIMLVLQDNMETGNMAYLPTTLDSRPAGEPYLAAGILFNSFSHEGNRLRLENVTFSGALEECIQPLIRYLRAEGCTETEYSFIEIKPVY